MNSHGLRPWLPMKSAPSRGARGYEFHLRYSSEYVTIFTPRSIRRHILQEAKALLMG